MLNFKKGLAIVLAAATALTFAPVSTAGLNAEAAQADTSFGNATFQNVPDTVYIRDTKDTSLTLSPSWVIRQNENSAKDGSNLYYQVFDDIASVSATVSKADYKDEFTGATTKVKFDTSKKGSVTLKNNSTNATFEGGDEYLAAYELSTTDNNYNIVGYKQIHIVPYTNATYDVTLKQNPVTLSMGVAGNETSDPVDIDNIYDQSGNKISSTGWTITAVYGTGISTASGASTSTIATYDDASKKFTAKNAGSSEVTVIATKADQVAVGTINLEVLGTSQYVIKATVDGTKNSAQIGLATNSPVILDVKNNNTYDLASHMYKNNDSIVLSYESSNSKNTVDATTGVVKATTVTDSFFVTVTGKINGKTVAKTFVYFKVNALPFNQLSVTGADKDVADVLNETEFAYTNQKAPISGMTEEKLAASQIKYIQIDVTGKETTDVTENLNIVSTSGAIVTASLEGQSKNNLVKGVSNAGVITVDHSRLNAGSTTGVAVIKLVSNPTTTTALTTSYIYVVVDKADSTISAADDYKIGTVSNPDNGTLYESEIEFKKKTGTLKARLLSTSADDITAEQNLYTADDTSKFLQTISGSWNGGTIIKVAGAEKQTEHVLLSYTTGDGTAYKVVTITSVPGVHNSITKIENATTGKVVYDSAKDSAVAVPELTLDGNTTLKVTIAYPIDKNDTHAGISSKSLYNGDDPLNQNIITATKDEKKANGYTTFYLYPTTQGTQVVTFSPSGDISATDHSIVADDSKSLSITYRASKTPSKVTNVKVANKKGAKVKVTFDAATNHNMKYWVQKKIGKKVAGKSVASNKTTLLVKKGATVKVRVKAYYYDNEGNKHVGKYSSWVTKKTDKK